MSAPVSPSPAARVDDLTGDALAARTVSLTKVYGRGEAAVRALDEVDLGIRAGRFTAIMGPSGSGKSTLLHCLAGLETPTSGQVWLGGDEISEMSDRALTLLRRRRVGFVFQSFNLVPVLTARQNITLPMKLAGRRIDRDRLDRLVETMGLTDRLGHRPAEMSGGQQQRVAIARALLANPDVVFADEPTGALDSRTSADLLGHLRNSVEALGQTVVMVTHDPAAATYADTVQVLADGRPAGTLEEPSAEQVLEAIGALGAQAR